MYFLLKALKVEKIWLATSPSKSTVQNLVFLPFLICWRRSDVITLQNPHGLPPASVGNAAALEKAKITAQAAAVKPLPSPVVSALKSKEPVPCMFS